MLKYIIFTIILIQLLCGCSKKSIRNPRLVEIDSTLQYNPNIAFSMIEKIESVKAEDSTYYNLLYCETLLLKNLTIYNHTIDSVIINLEKGNDKDLLARAYWCRAFNNYKKNKYTEATQDVITAENLTDKENIYQQTKIQLLIGIINHNVGCLELAKPRLQKACRLSDDASKYPEIKTLAYKYLADLYLKENKIDSAKLNLQKISSLVYVSSSQTYAAVKTSFGEMYMLTKEYKKAKKFLIEAKNYDLTSKSNYLLANIYKAEGNDKECEINWYIAANSNDLKIRRAALDSLLKMKPNDDFLYQFFYKNTGNDDSYDQYYIASMQNRLYHQQAQKKNFQLIILMLSVIIVILIIFMLFINYHRKKIKKIRKHIQKTNIHYMHDLEEYKKAKENIKLLEEKISLYQEDRQKTDKWNIENMMLEDGTVITLHRIASKGQMPTDALWQELNLLIGEKDQAITTFLCQYNNLTDKEKRICILIRLQFIPGEISSLLGISSQNVTNMRKRLLQRLFNKDGGAKDFDCKIRSL